MGENMTVGELKAALAAFNDEDDITVTNIHQGRFSVQRLPLQAKGIELYDGYHVCNINIGSCDD
jgi:hypothetical protein